MRARTITIAIGVAAAGVMALGAQTAAAVLKYDTRLTITTDGGGLYHGWVKSEVKKCRRGATGGPVQAAARGGSQARH